MADGDNDITSIWFNLASDQSDPWSVLNAVREARTGAFKRGDFQAVHYLQEMVVELIHKADPDIYGDDRPSGDVLSFRDYQKSPEGSGD